LCRIDGLYSDHRAFAAHRTSPDRFFSQFRVRAAVIFGRRQRNERRREQFAGISSLPTEDGEQREPAFVSGRGS